MLVNFSTLVLFLPAVREIEHSSVDVAEKVVVWLIITVIALLPVLLPVTLVALLGTRADPLLARLNAFVGRHARTIAIAIELVFAVVLAWKGSGTSTDLSGSNPPKGRLALASEHRVSDLLRHVGDGPSCESDAASTRRRYWVSDISGIVRSRQHPPGSREGIRTVDEAVP